MATTPYSVSVLIEHTDVGYDWEYIIFVNGKRMMTGERRTRGGAVRAARTQLKQLIKDIDKQLMKLT